MAAGTELMKLIARLTGGTVRGKSGGGNLFTPIASGVARRSGAPAWSWIASPVAAGLLGLLRRRKLEPAASEQNVETPKPQRYERSVAPERGWEAVPVERAAGEKPRVVERPVQVTIQAMDSRSFFDRQEEIAAAVRRAVLESSGSGEIGEEW
jgi:hypothetical protein